MRKYIVTTAGGLGNQMMNYALWYYLKYKMNWHAILYPKTKDLNDHNGYEISNLFLKTEEISSPQKSIDYLIKLYTTIDSIGNYIARMTGKKQVEYITQRLLPISIINFPHWHDYSCFESIKEDLVNIFTFPQDNDNRNIELIKEMHQCNSVSIHIRRGDYQSNTYWRMALGDICDLKYYKDAISLVNMKIVNPVFYIFSDDINWVKENLDLPNATYVSWNTGTSSYRDIQLMANCKTNIIANSTFSLMATWLNTNINAWHIVPLKWRNYHNDMTYKKYIPKNWTIIDNNTPNISIVLSKILTHKESKLIIKQKYTDFEIIANGSSNKFKDNRIKNEKTVPKGKHVFYLETVRPFEDRNYLAKLLAKSFNAQ